jgi:Lanthionine synthetase C-like protein
VTSKEDVLAIGDDLLSEVVSEMPSLDTVRSPYFKGLMLNALVASEALYATGHEDHRAELDRSLEKALKLLEGLPLSSSLYGGICGVGWVIQQYASEDASSWRHTMLADLDELIADSLEVTENLDVDIINGLAGIVIYANARGTQEPSSQHLWQVIDAKAIDYIDSWIERSDRYEPVEPDQTEEDKSWHSTWHARFVGNHVRLIFSSIAVQRTRGCAATRHGCCVGEAPVCERQTFLSLQSR